MSRVAASLYGFILGDVKEDCPDIKVLNSVARSNIPRTGSPEISEAKGK